MVIEKKKKIGHKLVTAKAGWWVVFTILYFSSILWCMSEISLNILKRGEGGGGGISEGF